MRHAQGFGPDLVKPTAWAALAPVHSHRLFVPPVSIKPGGAETPAAVRPAEHAVRAVLGPNRTAEAPTPPCELDRISFPCPAQDATEAYAADWTTGQLR